MTDTSTPPALPRVSGKFIMTPVIISALIYPGAGQFVQRRWVAGVIFLVAFSVALAWFVGRTLQVLAAYYDFAFNFNTASGQAPNSMGIAIPFGISLAVYLANIVDAALAKHK
jgi:hypothetical protein